MEPSADEPELEDDEEEEELRAEGLSARWSCEVSSLMQCGDGGGNGFEVLVAVEEVEESTRWCAK